MAVSLLGCVYIKYFIAAGLLIMNTKYLRQKTKGPDSVNYIPISGSPFYDKTVMGPFYFHNVNSYTYDIASH